ncbi:MAG: hypothetical protein DI597_00855 [Pseudoxanthomonas spadix]|nr:MAG: hypothetical protein DI597_00855 [Pseudoxanthomonas spadix]
MTACKECSNEISTTAKACPKCGAVVPKPKVWPWVVGVPVVVLIAMAIYGNSIPEYRIKAREVRDVCYKIAPLQRDVCDANYSKAIAEGEAAGAK